MCSAVENQKAELSRSYIMTVASKLCYGNGGGTDPCLGQSGTKHGQCMQGCDSKTGEKLEVGVKGEHENWQPLGLAEVLGRVLDFLSYLEMVLSNTQGAEPPHSRFRFPPSIGQNPSHQSTQVGMSLPRCPHLISQVTHPCTHTASAAPTLGDPGKALPAGRQRV